MADKDYYKVLGVKKDSSQDEIKKAFRELAKKHHPDVNQNNKDSEEKFKEINEAFQVLGNEKKKAQYDAGGYQHNNSNHNPYQSQYGNARDFNFEDIFNMFKQGQQTDEDEEDYEEGQDVQYETEISLEEAFTGVNKSFEIIINEKCENCDGLGSEKKDIKKCEKCNGQGRINITQRNSFIQFSRVVTCDKCKGSGKIATHYCNVCNGKGKNRKTKNIEIKIPRGVNSGQYLRLEGQGEAGRNAPSGDLYVIIRVRKHPDFKREEENLFLDKKISLSTAMFGDKIEIMGIDNSIIKLKIPAGTQSNSQFKIKKEGMPVLNSNSRGHLYVNIIVDIPKVSRSKEKDFKKIFG